MPDTIREPGWFLTAFPGALLYAKTRRIIDANILQFLDDNDALQDRRIADIGGGYGMFSVEAARRGASKVLLLDITPLMIQRTLDRAKNFHLKNRLKGIEGNMYDQLGGLEGEFSAINFGSSLYGTDEEVQDVLQNAHRLLTPGGFLTIKHPERDFRKYMRGHTGKVRIDHVLKYAINSLGNTLSLARWQPHFRADLQDICEQDGRRIHTWIDSPTPAYNVLAIRKMW